MQVNLNCNSPKPQQSFGTIHSSEAVNKAVARRIKKISDVLRLEELVKQADKNKTVDITLFADKDSRLSANVYSVNPDDNYIFKQYEEGCFAQLWKSPIEFIEKVVKSADRFAKKIAKKVDINDINKILDK